MTAPLIPDQSKQEYIDTLDMDTIFQSQNSPRSNLSRYKNREAEDISNFNMKRIDLLYQLNEQQLKALK